MSFHEVRVKSRPVEGMPEGLGTSVHAGDTDARPYTRTEMRCPLCARWLKRPAARSLGRIVRYDAETLDAVIDLLPDDCDSLYCGRCKVWFYPRMDSRPPSQEDSE